MDDKRFLEFCDKYGNDAANEVLEKITDVFCKACGTHASLTQDNISIYTIHMINACNHVFDGSITYDNQEYGFVIESGDRRGTVIREWGPRDDVGFAEEPEITQLDFIPKDITLKISRPEMYKLYLYWREQGWFKDKVRGYNYDRMFAPGGKTEKYYRDWADTKGLKIGIFEE